MGCFNASDAVETLEQHTFMRVHPGQVVPPLRRVEADHLRLARAAPRRRGQRLRQVAVLVDRPCVRVREGVVGHRAYEGAPEIADYGPGGACEDALSGVGAEVHAHALDGRPVGLVDMGLLLYVRISRRGIKQASG